MRCSRPGVPGIAHGRASVSSSRRYGQNSAGLSGSPAPWLVLVAKAGSIVGSSDELGDPPRLGAVGEHAVGQQHHRRAVGDRDPDGLQGRVEAVAGRARRDDRDRGLAVAPEHRLQQVGLLGLGRQSGRRATALDVDDQQRELGHHRQADRLRLQRDARAGGRGHAEAAGERRADGGADAGDLVLGLERRDAEGLVLAQLVEDVGGRRDRVGAEEQRQPRLHAPGDQAVGEREVAGDVAVGARRHRGRLDLVGDREGLGGLAEVPAGVVRRHVGVADVGDLGEALLQERDRRLGRPAVEPRQQAQGEHVLGAGGVLAREPELLDGLDGHPGQVDRVQGELVEAAVLERVGGVAGLRQVARGEVVGVDDDRGALGQVPEVGAQRRGVHRDQHVGGVAGREDVVVGEVHLERRDARQRALGRPDLGGEVRQRREVVAERRGLLREAVPGELHAVARVACEPNDHAVELLDLLGQLRAQPFVAWTFRARFSRGGPVLGATPPR